MGIYCLLTKLKNKFAGGAMNKSIILNPVFELKRWLTRWP
jgi:hypothetical protein